ncbi:MAG: sulfur carrier protein ThiS [Nitrospirota bacterium]|nr:MAG: sulfur carrier protein ThiS [Nitrospirota bacterium]
MKIKLNGDEYDTDAGTIGALLEELDIMPGRVAVELNIKIIKKDRYSGTVIKEGDEIEIVSFVGGGCNKS